MMRLFSLLALPLVFSYNVEPSSKKTMNCALLYRSTDDSFQQDFYLKIEDDIATVYGWEIAEDQDTVYYSSICKFDTDSTGWIDIRLEDYTLTDEKLHPHNLNNFIPKEHLGLPLFGAHSNFSGHQQKDGSLNLQAVKHIYCGRADQFHFVPIHP